MMDRLSTSDRSKNMSAIRSRNTKPELLVRQWLFAEGFRYRLNVKYIPGHPDLYMKKYNTAIFINGCFWHRHKDCKYAYTPKTNVEFWEKKFRQNIERDQKVKQELKNRRIKRLDIWECTVKQMRKDPEYKKICFEQIREFLNSSDLSKDI